MHPGQLATSKQLQWPTHAHAQALAKTKAVDEKGGRYKLDRTVLAAKKAAG
jgi:hypothetical protein